SSQARHELGSVQASQISQNQLRKIAAVAAFEEAEGRDVELANGLAQPMEIFGFECFLRERVAGVSIEARRNTNQIGLLFGQFVQRLLEDFSVFLTRCPGRDRKVETVVADIARAGAGIAGMLMDGVEER